MRVLTPRARECKTRRGRPFIKRATAADLRKDIAITRASWRRILSARRVRNKDEITRFLKRRPVICMTERTHFFCIRTSLALVQREEKKETALKQRRRRGGNCNNWRLFLFSSTLPSETDQCVTFLLRIVLCVPIKLVIISVP